ncbi:MAG: protein kinase [Lachnospiraceae bacterium]|nr:protein kinase [Lachnospiraceae bacterium]
MIDIQEQLKLSYYKEIATLNSKHRITVVQHQETLQIFAKKVLGIYNLDVYLSLKENPVSGMPRIFEAIAQDDELVIIEEYVSGQNLEQLINEQGSLSQKETVDYALKLCNILSELHSRKPAIIHRDIKPTNVIITPANELVLIDLNAAKYESEKEEDTKLLGTKGYAAPEQYGFGSSGVQTDIYAVGVLMRTMLNGSLSSGFDADSRLCKIINKCTELSPKLRYGSIEDLKNALEATHIVGKRVFPRKWISYLPPGFRSGNPGYMLIAVFVYYFVIFLQP